jgi:pimeloyl-ACP methyl ester carboxylesterase
MIHAVRRLHLLNDALFHHGDLRGHGESPLVKGTTLGGLEIDDTLASLDFLKSLKTETNTTLVGNSFGIYGVELGALAGLSVAAREPNVKALALDSIPLDSDDLLWTILDKKYPFASSITAKIAQVGTYLYFYNGAYSRESMCENAKTVSNKKIIILSGNDNPKIQNSSTQRADCFTNQGNVEKKLDLMPSGYNIVNASNEQSQGYDQRVIDFFQKSLLTSNE